MTEETTNTEATVANSATAEAPKTEGGFLDSLAEDLRGEASLKDFKDASALAKSYVNAQRMLGNSVRIPGEDASDEARAEFYKKLTDVPGVMQSPDWENEESVNNFYDQLGRPKTASEYKYEAPEGVEIDADQSAHFNELAHKLGLTNKQAQALVEFRSQEVLAESEALEAAKTQGESALKEIWGNDYNNRLDSAKAVAEIYSKKYPEAMEQLIHGPAGNNPAFLAMLSELAPMFQEKGTLQGTNHIQRGTSAEEAKEKILEIQSNPQHAFFNEYDPGHKAAVEKMRNLHLAAYPE